MLLEIDDNKTISHLQEKFNECFPYLRLEFFSKAHGWHGRSLPRDRIDENKKIGDITNKHQQGTLIIVSKQKTGEIEKAFKKIFGLFVQVCYLVNDKWVETKDTNDLTLQELSVIAESTDLKY